MTQKYTPEPWKLYRNDQSVGDAVGHAVCDVWPRGDDQLASAEGKANARRIAACVNACEGISTEDLECIPRLGLLNLSQFSSDLIAKRDHLQDQVDELLDLLKSLENDAEQMPQFMWEKIQNAVKNHTGETK